MIYALNKKIIDSLEIIKGCRKRLLYDLRCLQVHVYVKCWVLKVK